MVNYTHRYNCSTESETVELSKALANIAKIGDVFLLYGTLGMGKTVFARSFIKALSDTEEVPSPTFTLLQIYDGKSGKIYHFDLYRIKDPMEIFELGIEEAIYSGISLIEWPEKMGNYLPRDVFTINITQDKTSDRGRLIEIIINSEEKESRLKTIKI